jgi:hypothetical protein
MMVSIKAGDSSSWPYYVGTAVSGLIVGGVAVVVVNDQLNKGCEQIEDGLKRAADHASEKLTSDTEENAEKLVQFLLGGKEIEKEGNGVSPLDKISDTLKNTIESTGHQIAADFSQHIEQSGHQLTVDLAQNVGRMMLSYTLGLFGAFFAYKQIVDYFAFQEKIDHLDIAAQEQNMFLLPQGNFASFLQKREAALIAAKRTHLEHEQNRKFYLAGCGTLTFAAACGLCSYWIQ